MTPESANVESMPVKAGLGASKPMPMAPAAKYVPFLADAM